MRTFSRKLELVVKNGCTNEEIRWDIETLVFSGAKRELNKAVAIVWDDIVAWAKSVHAHSVRATLYDFDTTESLATRKIEPWEIYGESYFEED